jgi:lysosomal-associated membrane protein 1/2
LNYTASNATCIFAEFAVQIEVPYITLDNKTWTAYVNVFENATATGLCDNKTTVETLTLTWENNSVTFSFEKDVNKTYYNVKKVDVAIVKDPVNFPNAANASQNINLVYDGKALFNTTEKMSYKCAKLESFNLTMANEKKPMGFLHFSHLQLQAFSESKATGFADAIDCEPAGTPDIVPIAAGCALAILILIVLGAYLIGRRRSQASGYVSM